MTPGSGFSVQPADYAVQRDQLHGVRHAVFVNEQRVPAELEVDALDPLSHHVLALDADGRAIGAGRLTPERRIGRMAVLPGWRSQGVGDALLAALVGQARALGWGEVSLHAQLPARDFYARNGFLPEGPTFQEAGIEHQTMRQRLDGALRVSDREQALAAAATVIHRARRGLYLHLRCADDLFGEPLVLGALRRFAAARHDKQMQVLAEEADLVALPAAVLGLFQRLPSVFVVRTPVDPTDVQVASGRLGNDIGDCYFRPMGVLLEGELTLAAHPRIRAPDEQFQRIWQRSRDCNALRVLGI
ncbi:GNAT family N-acetyltransferase [Stenotrophomonas sp.]|uniref:GNAT family N-acetyltransferase n=1 Tax=Stenotrophomonas sp. TaxID=69392 RepID=UPI0028A5B7B3|nr:GNAT family N-acetyltransferase [Stenotrophomonas sp.]